jgi:hypothetical protein
MRAVSEIVACVLCSAALFCYLIAVGTPDWMIFYMRDAFGNDGYNIVAGLWSYCIVSYTDLVRDECNAYEGYV